MTYADRLQRWNRWYDETPQQWRFHLVVWGLVAVGAINMFLTIAFGFPFALLLLLAILAIAAVRVPYRMGWVQGLDASAGESPRMEIEAPAWVLNLNRWYDGLSDLGRAFVLLAALAIPGAINMAVTISSGFPFGLLFLLAVLVVLAIRAPYVAGWYKESAVGHGATLALTPQAPQLGNDVRVTDETPRTATAVREHESP